VPFPNYKFYNIFFFMICMLLFNFLNYLSLLLYYVLFCYIMYFLFYLRILFMYVLFLILIHCVVLCIIYALMWPVLLPPSVNPIAANKYIISMLTQFYYSTLHLGRTYRRVTAWIYRELRILFFHSYTSSFILFLSVNFFDHFQIFIHIN
jgi:hypothetical protein